MASLSPGAFSAIACIIDSKILTLRLFWVVIVQADADVPGTSTKCGRVRRCPSDVMALVVKFLQGSAHGASH